MAKVSLIFRDLGFPVENHGARKRAASILARFVPTVFTVFLRGALFDTLQTVDTLANGEFTKLHRELEEVVSKLKNARDPRVTRRLLRQMRLLLAEADHILDSSPA